MFSRRVSRLCASASSITLGVAIATCFAPEFGMKGTAEVTARSRKVVYDVPSASIVEIGERRGDQPGAREPVDAATAANGNLPAR
jgi:hypothetical protein